MNTSSLKFVFPKRAVFASLIVGALLAVVGSRAADEHPGAQVKPILSEKLPNVPGKSLTAVLVYPQATLCDQALFIAQGWRGCFAAAGLSVATGS